MKKLFPNYLFCKIGLLISSYVVDLSQLKIEADEALNITSNLWPSSTDSLDSLLSQGEVFNEHDSNKSIFSPSPSLHNSKQLNKAWNASSDDIQSSKLETASPIVFFPFESTPERSSLEFDENSVEDYIPNNSLTEPPIERQRLVHTLTSEEDSPPGLIRPSELSNVNSANPSYQDTSSINETVLARPYTYSQENLDLNNLTVPSTNQNSNIVFPKSTMTPPAKELVKPQLRALDADIAQESAVLNQNKSSNGGKTILINFNNVNIIEFIRFISRISNKNFVFDDADLQFNVTIVSEEPTTIENIMTALLQELRIHELTLIEQGNNLIIHKNPKVNSVSRVVAEDLPGSNAGSSEIVTQVFRLNTLESDRAAAVIRPLVSENAILEFIKDTNHLIVTDLHSNVLEIAKLLKSLDAPNSGLVIGQYVAKSTDVESLLPLVQQIMSPISKDSPLVFVPYLNSNSIFIVSTPFLVERSLSILEHLDQEKGRTRIIDLEKLQFLKSKNELQEGKSSSSTTPTNTPLIPSTPGGASASLNNLQNIPVSPDDLAPFKELESPYEAKYTELLKQLPPPPNKLGLTEFIEEVPILKEKIQKKIVVNDNFIPVPVSRAKFYIHKVQYRRGDVLLSQIQQIATSMQNTKGNDELLNVISTADYLQDSKALVFTGTPEYLEKVKALIEELDIPLRQVYIEMLILSTTINDSLNYAVNFGSDFGGGNQAGAQTFATGASVLPTALNTAGTTNIGSITPNPGTTAVPFNNAIAPSPTPFINNVTGGYSLGILGQHIFHKGLGLKFNTIAALVNALHTRTSVDIILNPKIIAEDNVPAQIFVGVTTPFKTQAISNEQGSIITNNFEYRDVGTSLQVTPHIHNSDMITLEIMQERSSLASTPASTGNSNDVLGPTTNKNSTKTTVHVPNGFFVIISGMLEDDITRTRTQVPCLGSIPLIGGGFSDKTTMDAKTNLMIFLRPVIVDSDEELQNLTRHQQDVWDFKNQMPKEWVQEVEEALDFLNVRRTQNTDDEDDPPCHQFDH